MNCLNSDGMCFGQDQAWRHCKATPPPSPSEPVGNGGLTKIVGPSRKEREDRGDVAAVVARMDISSAHNAVFKVKRLGLRVYGLGF